MKVLFDHPSPFLLAHGGFQIQIEQTKAALQAIGVEVEYLRWWDGGQKADLIHYFSPASVGYLEQARAKQLPVVMTSLFTETCNRSDAQLRRQGWMTQAILAAPMGEGIKRQLTWRTYGLCSLNVVGLEAERAVLETVYRVPPERIAIVPLGLSETYLQAGAGDRSQPFLVCTGRITPTKRSVELAELARNAQVPVLFVGKPHHESDPYWLRFKRLIDGEFVRYHEHIDQEADMAQLLQKCRGFVLYSCYENWCLSAHEAAVCGLPLLVPDQKWSRERFGDAVSYFSGDSVANDTRALRQFYDAAPTLSAPGIRLDGWTEVARQLKELYLRVLKTSR